VKIVKGTDLGKWCIGKYMWIANTDTGKRELVRIENVQTTLGLNVPLPRKKPKMYEYEEMLAWGELTTLRESEERWGREMQCSVTYTKPHLQRYEGNITPVFISKFNPAVNGVRIYDEDEAVLAAFDDGKLEIQAEDDA